MVQKINLTEFGEAMKDPTIVHDIFCSPKHWKKRTKARDLNSSSCYKYQGIFYHYAKKTKYYQEIYNKYMK